MPNPAPARVFTNMQPLQWSRETVLTTQTTADIRVNQPLSRQLAAIQNQLFASTIAVGKRCVWRVPRQPFHSLEKPMLNVITVDFESALPTVKPPTFLDVGQAYLPGNSGWMSCFIPQATCQPD